MKFPNKIHLPDQSDERLCARPTIERQASPSSKTEVCWRLLKIRKIPVAICLCSGGKDALNTMTRLGTATRILFPCNLKTISQGGFTYPRE
jgi:hypothetical protein